QILRRSALMKCWTSSASCSSGGITPQTGRGQAASLERRAMMWTCSCGTTLPRAAIFSLSHLVMSFSARPPRHQQQPGVMRVLDDQHSAERQVADVDGVFLDL